MCKHAACRWYHAGTLPVPARRAGCAASWPSFWLARFGTEHLQAALAAQGRQIIMLDDAELEDDLARDMTEVLTSFCARLYGRRGARNGAQRALDCAQTPGA
jgi:hypothetical protein